MKQVEDEILGLGPLEPLLADPSVSDILVNGRGRVYVERYGKLESTPLALPDAAHLMNIIDRIVSAVGRRMDESAPMVDARLKDGSRVNAIVPPLAMDGPVCPSGDSPWTAAGARTWSVGRPHTDDGRGAGRCRKAPPQRDGVGRNGIAGKTTMLNTLSGFIPEDERIITIEDSAELQLQQPHIVRLETRPANIEGKGEVKQRDLVRNSLRMRPERIVVGEVRGEEALDMLQAMNTGHDGSLTTVHANYSRDALARLENMVAMAGLNCPPGPCARRSPPQSTWSAALPP